ncbi:50S ribosomal protein L13 [Candidatus Altiarchaeota archaeon]
MIINAEGQVLGRMCTFVAKQALLGREVIVVNAEKAIVTGNKETILNRQLAKLEIRNKGNYRKGPFHQRRPDRFVRRTIRGMLPFKQERGRQAMKKIQVYMGIPHEEIKKNHNFEVKEKDIHVLEEMKHHIDQYMTIAEICNYIGGSGNE